MAIPERIEAPKAADYLAVMSRAVFQAGLSWKLIESKWDAYLRSFDRFDPVLVAAYDDTDVERIVADGGVVRTRKKIAGTIENARTLLHIERDRGMRTYLQSFASYADLAADLRRRFKYLGELSVYYFLFRVGEPVPRFEDWERTISGDHPRMREMIAHARALGWKGEIDGYAAQHNSVDARHTMTKTSATKKATTKATADKATTKKPTAKKPTAKKATPEKATAKKSGATTASPRKYGPKASESVRTAMDEMKRGTLRSGTSGKKVTDPKQAIAIGLSEARRSGAKVPPEPEPEGDEDAARAD